MRKVAYIEQGADYEKLMIYDCEDGVYLFMYEKKEQRSCNGDYWFETLEDAQACAQEMNNGAQVMWRLIDDPLPYCQDDVEEPVRVVGRDVGKPQWGCFEELVQGQWVRIDEK